MNTSKSYSSNPASRLQQQPQRFMDRQQQQCSGSGEFQPLPVRSNWQTTDRQLQNQAGSNRHHQMAGFSEGQSRSGLF